MCYLDKERDIIIHESVDQNNREFINTKCVPCINKASLLVIIKSNLDCILESSCISCRLLLAVNLLNFLLMTDHICIMNKYNNWILNIRKLAINNINNPKVNSELKKICEKILINYIPPSLNKKRTRE